MFERFYNWAMRNGSRLLFAIALILPIKILLESLSLIGTFTLFQVASHMMSAVAVTLMPLLAALLVNRIDRFVALRDRDPASG
jgi:hypothetical protein